MKKLITLLVILFGFASAQDVILFNNSLPAQHPLSKTILQGWVDAVNEAGEGVITVIQPDAPLAPAPQQWDLVASGAADAAWILNAFAPITLAKVADLPMLSGTPSQKAAAMWAVYQAYFAELNEYEDRGMKLLGHFTVADGGIYSLGDAIITPADIESVNTWALPGTPTATANALGANPVTGPAVQVYEVVSSGAVDAGMGIPPSDMIAFNLIEFVKTYTNIGLYAPSFSLIISLDKWNSLSAESQEAILSVSGANMVSLAEDFEALEGSILEKTVEAGLIIEEPSQELVDAIIEGTSGLVDDWIAEASETGVDAEAALAFYKALLGN